MCYVRDLQIRILCEFSAFKVIWCVFCCMRISADFAATMWLSLIKSINDGGDLGNKFSLSLSNKTFVTYEKIRRSHFTGVIGNPWLRLGALTSWWRCDNWQQGGNQQYRSLKGSQWQDIGWLSRQPWPSSWRSYGSSTRQSSIDIPPDDVFNGSRFYASEIAWELSSNITEMDRENAISRKTLL
jgi:hypothetical protein